MSLFVCLGMCVCVHTSVKAHKRRSEDNHRDLVLCFHPAGPGHQPSQPALCAHTPLPPARYSILFNELTNLICQYFIERFCNCAHEGCICVYHGLKDFFPLCLLFVWHWCNSLRKQVDELSVLPDFLGEIIKIIDSPAF